MEGYKSVLQFYFTLTTQKFQQNLESWMLAFCGVGNQKTSNQVGQVVLMLGIETRSNRDKWKTYPCLKGPKWEVRQKWHKLL